MRDKRIDYLKGFTIILVILGHVVQYGHTDYDENVVYNIIYSFHMPLFMFLSGWVINYSLKKGVSFLTFIKKRFIGLMIPFITWAIIGSVYRSFSRATVFDIDSFIVNLKAYFLRPEHGLWYCWVLFFACLIHGILYKLPEKVGVCLLIAVAVCLWILRLPNVFGLHNLQKLFVFYVAGYLISKYKYGSNTVFNVVVVALWLVSIYLVVSHGHRHIIDEKLIETRYDYMLLNRLILALIAGTWIYVLFVFAKKIKQFDCIVLLGKYSLDLYVFQGFPTVAVRKIKYLIAGNDIFDILFTIVYTGILTIGIYYFSKKVIRKNKYLSLLLLGKTSN